MIAFDDFFVDSYGGTRDILTRFRKFQSLGAQIDSIIFSRHVSTLAIEDTPSGLVFRLPYRSSILSFVIALFTFDPFSSTRRQAKFSDLSAIADLLGNYDLHFIESQRCFNFYCRLQQLISAPSKIVLRVHNVESSYFAALASCAFLSFNIFYCLSCFFESFAYRILEYRLFCSNHIIFLFISKQDMLRARPKKSFLLPFLPSSFDLLHPHNSSRGICYLGNLRIADNLSVLQSYLVHLDLFASQHLVPVHIIGSCSVISRLRSQFPNIFFQRLFR